LKYKRCQVVHSAQLYEQEISAIAEKPARLHVAGRACTVCEIFTFKLYGDLETGVEVTQGH